MSFIVARQPMNLPKLIAIACSAIVLASCANQPSSLISEPRSSKSGRTFADWCRERDFLIPEAKQTVELLLQKAGTTECDEADRELLSLTKLEISYYSLRDIKALESLTNLKELHLNGNNISDIKPLTSLTNLTVLNLGDNQIRDIKPLTSLTNLKELNLGANNISDIILLKSLTKLTVLDLSRNPIARRICPLKPESICLWGATPNKEYDQNKGYD